MIEILFLACSTVAPIPLCEQKRLTFASEPGTLSVFQCAHYGQSEMAKWAEANPMWRIAPGGYKCRPAGLYAKA